jgi:hypothetical protein
LKCRFSTYSCRDMESFDTGRHRPVIRMCLSLLEPLKNREKRCMYHIVQFFKKNSLIFIHSRIWQAIYLSGFSRPTIINYLYQKYFLLFIIEIRSLFCNCNYHRFFLCQRPLMVSFLYADLNYFKTNLLRHVNKFLAVLSLFL